MSAGGRRAALAVTAAGLLLGVVLVARQGEGPSAVAGVPPSVTTQEWKRRTGDVADGVGRDQLFRSAAEKGTQESVTFLADQAASSDPAAHLAAAALGSVRNPAARPVLREVSGSTSILAASNAIRALGTIGRPEDLGLLRALTELSERTRVWHEAVRALGKLSDPRAREILEALLESARDAQESLSILAGLGSSASAESVPALQRFLARDDLSPPERSFAELTLKTCRR